MRATLFSPTGSGADWCRLPQEAWDDALDAVERADLVVVIGTSLQVYPANQLPGLTSGNIAIINMEKTPLDQAFGMVLRGKAGDILQHVDALLEA